MDKYSSQIPIRLHWQKQKHPLSEIYWPSFLGILSNTPRLMTDTIWLSLLTIKTVISKWLTPHHKIKRVWWTMDPVYLTIKKRYWKWKAAFISTAKNILGASAFHFRLTEDGHILISFHRTIEALQGIPQRLSFHWCSEFAAQTRKSLSPEKKSFPRSADLNKSGLSVS